MKKRFIAVIMSLVMCASLVLPVGYADVKADVKSAEILDTDVSEASDGCTLLGVYGTYYSQAMEALDKLNEIRKEACEEGDVPDPRNPERMLTADDYVPLKWSGDLESVAKIRAVEAGIAYAFMDSGHNRLNDKNTFSISYNGISGSAEDLAYNDTTDMGEGIMQFYMEKQYWVKENPTGEETGHYTSIINPKYKYVGCGDFYSKVGRFSNTLAMELSEKEGLDESMLRAKKDVMQKIEVADQYIKEYTIEGDSEINTDATANYTVRVKIQRNNAVRSLWALGIDSFSSSDTSIATVTDDGVVTAIKNGTVTITAKSGDKVVATKDITVKCTHNKKIKNYTPATCQTEGKKTYYCDKCDYTEEKNIPKKAHDYVYGDVESDGKRTGVCSVCGDISYIDDSGIRYTFDEDINGNKTFKADAIPRKTLTGEVEIKEEMAIGDVKYPVASIETGAFEGQSQITKIIVPEKIEKIGTKAFAGCSSLVEINFYPKTVPVIEDKLFGDMDTSKITVNTLSNALGYYVIREKENVTVQSGLKSRHIHTMQYHEPVSATCEKTGTVAYYSCSGCGKLYCDEQGIAELKESALTVPALGHAWESDYTIDKPATKNTAGEKSIHCMRCDARTDIQTIPATGGSDDQNGSDDNSNNSSDSNSGNNNSGTSGGDSPGSNTSKKKKYPKKGKKVTVKGIRYKVTGVVAKTKKFEVSCTGSKSKKITKLSIPEYVIISGIKFKVTAIDKKAFYKYTKLKTVTIGKNVKTFGTQAFAKSSKISKITIKTTKLTKKSVGKNVFSGIKKKAKFTYPKSKKAVYKKIFKA